MHVTPWCGFWNTKLTIVKSKERNILCYYLLIFNSYLILSLYFMMTSLLYIWDRRGCIRIGVGRRAGCVHWRLHSTNNQRLYIYIY
ncbi:hypothetical protein BCR42DRAFT_57297 [Absidia repens]|uniref:Uncharacterized protein n=1 Tax=Absidia repens TaxID=90262 RepID=A0A1X2IE02_9FUNG|nr:hypothetical protein BCR42DRAFT_57297 [Absidia repens]